MLNRRAATIALGWLTVSTVLAKLHGVAYAADGKGEYRGKLISEWLADGRRMKLLEPLEYIDPSGRRWLVPSGTVVDGASIPQVFWSVIGAPFSGPYRNASVVHDYFCDTRSRPYPDVHRVFYDAMKTSGVAERKAWVMYKAVENFGPRWDAPKTDPKCQDVGPGYDFEKCAQAARRPAVRQPTVDRAALEKFVGEIKTGADPADVKALEAELRKLK
jgi:hypothetical protein